MCGHELQDRFALAAQIHQRFAAAQRGLGGAQEAENQLLRFGAMYRAVALFLGPAGAGYEEQLGVGPEWSCSSALGACTAGYDGPGGRYFHRYGFHGRSFGRSIPRRVAAGIEQHHPGTLLLRQQGFHPLPVIPACHRRRRHFAPLRWWRGYPRARPAGRPRRGARATIVK